MTTPTWNHLWYVVYLLVYTLILCLFAPLFRLLNGPIDRAVSGSDGAAWRILLLPVIPFLVYRFTLAAQFPTTHALVDDWANHANSFTIFLIGFFIAKNEDFWRGISRIFPVVAVVVAICVPILGYYWTRWDTLTPDTALMNILRAGRIFYAWWVIVLLLGFAQKFMNRPSALLTYMTGSVFSWYILHQTITVSAGYYLAQMPLNWFEEISIITAITIGGCFIATEFVRRIPIVRIFFGLKNTATITAAVSAVPDRPASSPV